MLFNSFGFIFVYFPTALAGFFLASRLSHRLAAAWLALASLFFYAWWNPRFLAVLLLSILFNYCAGQAIGRTRTSGTFGQARFLLFAAVAINLAALVYFKYVNFFIQTADMTGASWKPLDIVLPLGISFFTFTQIAFLVDVNRGVAHEYDFIHYVVFVTFFPHLIAGPILHHKQMMPQFSRPTTYAVNFDNIAVGTTIFILGLFKKVVIADQMALYANPIFDAAAAGSSPKLVEAWTGALAYALQLYFDFSGYSDMAIGLARFFNVKLPLNFNSPYKASNIIEFWRRWHMTLSTFLRDYLYFPLGGNRHGPASRYMNLMITMLLGGLWHGAGWTFVIWGALHGIYLCLNHLWQHVTGGERHTTCLPRPLGKIMGTLLTFCLVVVAWVPFRASDLHAAWRMLRGMAGSNGVALLKAFEPHLSRFNNGALSFEGLLPLTKADVLTVGGWLCLGLAIVWLLPNTQEWMARTAPAWNKVENTSRFSWRPTRRTAIALGFMFAISIIEITRASSFLYFQF